MIVARLLDFDKDLARQFLAEKKFSDQLIEKLNAHYARVHKIPKHKSLLDKFDEDPSRPRLNVLQVKQLASLNISERKLLANMLYFDDALTKEFVKGRGRWFSPETIAKLDIEYGRAKAARHRTNAAKQFESGKVLNPAKRSIGSEESQDESGKKAEEEKKPEDKEWCDEMKDHVKDIVGI
ncbi:hypothetical protein F66182_10840 [Fusarium sp. NRRL 66182]|nr:hypothetical protein F66182_10840 [Fusarium sp. NRRL 66182]